MAIIKCKMCGGDMNISADKTFGTCEYCGSVMTLPKVDDEQLAAAFNRGNQFRRIGEFDKALSVYERIVQEDNANAEAHWCCALCRYGIEYVEDPATMEYIPTCHRVSFSGFHEDPDYLAAVEYSDGLAKRQYMKEATRISEVQKGIIAASQNDEPYDVFICYKESEDDDTRTKDSIIAQDIYYQLSEQGYRVFFSRITLEDKSGTQYEPYIFAALNSSKVMITVGTSADHLNAVWVKNEWSRFLALMKNDRSKLLLPCYKDMNPYDLPDALSVLQSYDMGKIGFIQDLIRGVKKVLDGTPKSQPSAQETIVSASSINVASLLKRAFMFLEDGDCKSADEYCEKVLDIDPECAEAYLGKLMAELKVNKKERLADCAQPFDASSNYQKAVRFGGEKLKAELEGYVEHIKNRNENTRLNGIYNDAIGLMSAAKTEGEFKVAAGKFASIMEFNNSAKLKEKCLDEAELSRKNEIYEQANKWQQLFLLLKHADIVDINRALGLYEQIPGYKDADEQAKACKRKIEETKVKNARKAEEALIAAEKRKKQNIKIAKIAGPIVCAVIAFIIVLNTVILPANNYKKAVALYDSGSYGEAIAAFEALGDYRDAPDKITTAKAVLIQKTYDEATALTNGGNDLAAIRMFQSIYSYKDSASRIADLDKMELTVSSGSSYTVGLKSDGTVVAIGNNYYGQCDVSGWKEIVAVSAGNLHTVGLKSDGTVVAIGNNDDGQCNVSDWKNIVAVSAGLYQTVGVKSDGTAVAVGANYYGQCDVTSWTDIVAVSAGNLHTVGLKADGTVVAVGSDGCGQCDVSGWKNIVSVSAGVYHTVGLKSDGTVVAVGSNGCGQCDVSEWKGIVAVSAGSSHTVGLKSDGTVVAVGYNGEGQCYVSEWKGIVAVSSGDYHTVGLKSDATVVEVGDNDNGQCDVEKWQNIKIP